MRDKDSLKLLVTPADYGEPIAEQMYSLNGDLYSSLLEPAWEVVKRRAETDPSFRTGLEPLTRMASPKDWMKLSAELANTLQMPQHLSQWIDRPIGIVSHLHREVLL